MVDLLDEVVMQENELRDQVQRLIEAATAHREMASALRQAEARRAIGVVQGSEEVDAMLQESRAMLDTVERRLFALTGRSDVASAYAVVVAAERFLAGYDQRVFESTEELAARFCELGEQGREAAHDLHEMLDLAVDARKESLHPLRQLLRRSTTPPVVVENGKQLTLVH